MDVRFLPAGDSALVVEFGDRIDRALSERVLALSRRIRAAAVDGIVETVPTFRSLLVHYDSLRTNGARLVAALQCLLGADERTVERRRRWRVPACYARDCAPDLDEVASRCGLTTCEVVARHAATQFYVYMIGFTPGYPYMGDLPSELHLPRRVDPRVRVPSGSVAIASALTTIYPLESPGGWHLIGATPIRLFDPGAPEPSLFAAGDLVRFEPIDVSEYEAIRAAVARNAYTVPCEDVGP
jgi:KipI family sensor histidine kinase inhibitor